MQRMQQSLQIIKTRARYSSLAAKLAPMQNKFYNMVIFTNI